MKILALARLTFRELLVERLHYSGLAIAAFFLFLTLLLGQLTVGDPVRVILDLGLASVHGALWFQGVLLGAVILPRELERRTVYLFLSRPMGRPGFVLGKFLGLVAGLGCNWLLLSLLLFGTVTFIGGVAGGSLAAALGLAFLHVCASAALSMALSSFCTPAVSFTVVAATVAVGMAREQVDFALTGMKDSWSGALLRVIHGPWPDFGRIGIPDAAIYGLEAFAGDLLSRWVYGAVLTLVFLAAACVSFESRDV